MISKTQIETMFGDYSNNTSTANLARGLQLANIEHRYLLEKYFANEASYSITTVGSQALTLTGTLAIGARTATLNAVWAFYSAPATVVFSSSDTRIVRFEKGSATITWDAPLTAVTTTSITMSGMQTYPLPPDYSKLKTGTLTIGALRWNPTEILSRGEWDNLNVFPYYADIPNNIYIWQRQFNLWPIPATTGNIISFNYKRRVPDLSIADYNTDTNNGTVTGAGTVTATNGSVVITGSSTVFTVTTNVISESRWIRIPFAAGGDNLWYQIYNVDSTTQITLTAPYQGATAAGAVYTVGQMPLLIEDFQDMLVWKALMFYWSTIVEDPKKFEEFEGLYKEKLALLNEYAGTKTLNVNLSRRGIQRNPNLYPQSLT